MEQHEVLAELGKVGAARRGHISEQWYAGRDKNGATRRTGPYYVWQRFVGGRKVSARIPRDEAAQALVELERGRAASALIEQFWTNAEAAAAAQKKTTGRTARAPLARNSGRPSR